MNRALYIAKTGLDVQNTRIAVISHNLANANTIGYKKERAEFNDLMYQNVRQPGMQSDTDTTLPSGLQLGAGATIVSTQRQHTDGNIIQTDNPLDMAIDGEGFFQILMPDGTISYTRDGSFRVNQNGDVVNAEGYPLEPNINVPTNVTDIMIAGDGTVSGVVPGQAAAPANLGQIELANFINPAGLSNV
ncbi:MAG: flagellar basal body rod protein FlgG, partial [Moraxella osloensis]|nr:flagellar basal body rod protein FlgG [Moraxella osloensis]